jgi:hypothetical protein
MKRRKFMQYVLLSSTSSLTNLHSLTYRQANVAFSQAMSSQRTLVKDISLPTFEQYRQPNFSEITLLSTVYKFS